MVLTVSSIKEHIWNKCCSSANGVTMVIPFDGGISVIEMDEKCTVKKTGIESLLTFFASFREGCHSSCYVRVRFFNSRQKKTIR